MKNEEQHSWALKMWNGFSFKIAMCFFCFLHLAAMDADSVGVAQNECAETRCSRHGPAIRFPFRLKVSHPKHCGYAGFELSCTHNYQTVLELPDSVKLFVKKINYRSQTIHLSDPDEYLARHFRDLNLSSSPFQYMEDYPLPYFVFACVTEPKGYEFMAFPPCVSASGQTLYAIAPVFLIKDVYLSLVSCTKLYEISSMSQQVLLQKSNDFVLRWLTPSCSICEAQGTKCRLKKTNNNDNSTEPAETECYDRGHKHNKGNTFLCLFFVVSSSFFPINIQRFMMGNFVLSFCILGATGKLVATGNMVNHLALVPIVLR